MSTDAEGIIPRFLSPPSRSFFLFGPRGTGKSTWLRRAFPKEPRIDLLDSSLYLELTGDPHRLEALVGSRPQHSWVILDEIQRVPALLDEVHRLIETRRWRFALCGSSARKLRRGGANLLAGRALTMNMEGLSAGELGDRFDASFSIEWGSLPLVQTDRQNAAGLLAAYVDTYLKEEIRAEGLVRNLPPFVRFLAVAGQLNGQVVSGSNIARDAAIPRSTVDAYFTTLTDTLIGHFLPAWRPSLKVRESAHPKFYWFDPGVARAAAGWHRDAVDRTWKGTALETLVYHELRVYNEVTGKHRPIAYYGTPSGAEVDFVIETHRRSSGAPARVLALEVKLAPKWRREWEKPMRDLASDPKVRVDRCIGVYTGDRRYQFGPTEVLPVEEFLQALHGGNLF